MSLCLRKVASAANEWTVTYEVSLGARPLRGAYTLYFTLILYTLRLYVRGVSRRSAPTRRGVGDAFARAAAEVRGLFT